jgi:DNA-binding transcriptional LysR family regulator
MDRLDAMEMFVRIVETGSFSAVARQLGTTQPTVSKQLTALEKRLGTRLLQRSTRRLSVTESGQAYYERCKRIVDAVREAEGTLGRLQTSLTGNLNVNTSIALGEMFVASVILKFQQRYPQIAVELTLNDRFIDLVEEGADVAIRIGRLADSTLVARRLGSTRRLTVATPGYLERRGVPAHPADLADHNCLLYSYLSTGNEWHFQGPDGEIRVRVSGAFKSNSGHTLLQAVRAGMGIAMGPDWLMHDLLASGEVRAILTEYAPRALDINAVYPSNRLVSAKMRAFVEFLQQEFAQIPALNAKA